MKVLQIGITGAVLVVLAGCSTLGADGKRIDYGAAAKQVPSLEVPPDLTMPGSDERYKVPQNDGGIPADSSEGVAIYSEYSKGGAAQAQVASAVLPEVPGVHLERSGAQRWLAVSDKAENVWPVVKAFWEETGLVISSEEQAAGVMETDWKENRARIPRSSIRDVFGKVFDNAYTSGQRDQYVTRMQRSKDGKATEIYITHRGMVEVYSPDMTTSKWVQRANEPELEAIMLQRLMVRFGAGEAQAASAVAAVSTVAAAGAIAASGAAAISTSEPAGTASLRETTAGSVVIVINDPFDRSWRKVGLAIESSGLVVEDKDRDKGIYYLRPVKIERRWWDSLKFWKASKEDKSHYRVIVSEKLLAGQPKDGGAACEVSVTDQDGASSNVTKQMTEAIYKKINQ